MLTTLAAILLGAANGGVEGGSQQPAGVTTELRADKERYVMGEPVRLRYTVTNSGSKGVFGHPFLSPSLPKGIRQGQLFYCWRDAPCVEFHVSRPDDRYANMRAGWIELGPGKSQVTDFWLALRPGQQQFVLDRAGEIEFRWASAPLQTSRGSHRGLKPEAVAASGYLAVEPPPGPEAEALASLGGTGAGLVAGYDPEGVPVSEGDRSEALAFLEGFPESVFAASVRNGLIRLLEERRTTLSSTDLELLMRLRSGFGSSKRGSQAR